MMYYIVASISFILGYLLCSIFTVRLVNQNERQRQVIEHLQEQVYGKQAADLTGTLQKNRYSEGKESLMD